MAALDFPGRIEHGLEHQRLLRDAEDFAFSIGSVFGPVECLAVARYLRLWMVRHIAESDRAFGESACARSASDTRSKG